MRIRCRKIISQTPPFLDQPLSTLKMPGTSSVPSKTSTKSRIYNFPISAKRSQIRWSQLLSTRWKVLPCSEVHGKPRNQLWMSSRAGIDTIPLGHFTWGRKSHCTWGGKVKRELDQLWGEEKGGEGWIEQSKKSRVGSPVHQSWNKISGSSNLCEVSVD